MTYLLKKISFGAIAVLALCLGCGTPPTAEVDLAGKVGTTDPTLLPSPIPDSEGGYTGNGIDFPVDNTRFAHRFSENDKDGKPVPGLRGVLFGLEESLQEGQTIEILDSDIEIWLGGQGTFVAFIESPEAIDSIRLRITNAVGDEQVVRFDIPQLSGPEPAPGRALDPLEDPETVDRVGPNKVAVNGSTLAAFFPSKSPGGELVEHYWVVPSSGDAYTGQADTRELDVPEGSEVCLAYPNDDDVLVHSCKVF